MMFTFFTLANRKRFFLLSVLRPTYWTFSSPLVWALLFQQPHCLLPHFLQVSSQVTLDQRRLLLPPSIKHTRTHTCTCTHIHIFTQSLCSLFILTILPNTYIHSRSSPSARLEALWVQGLCLVLFPYVSPMSVFMKQEHRDIGIVAWAQILELASSSCVILGKWFISLSPTHPTYQKESRRMVIIYAKQIVAFDMLLLSVWKCKTSK